jgi:hypothetical protein
MVLQSSLQFCKLICKEQGIDLFTTEYVKNLDAESSLKFKKTLLCSVDKASFFLLLSEKERQTYIADIISACPFPFSLVLNIA